MAARAALAAKGEATEGLAAARVNPVLPASQVLLAIRWVGKAIPAKTEQFLWG
jgi:hypothetical protein